MVDHRIRKIFMRIDEVLKIATVHHYILLGFEFNSTKFFPKTRNEFVLNVESTPINNSMLRIRINLLLEHQNH